MNSRVWEWVEHKYTGILPIGSLRMRLTLGAFWSLVGTIISQGLALVASIVVARLLGQVGFGELGIIKSTVGMLGIAAGLGLGMTATKYVATLRTTEPDRAGRILGLSMVAAVISGGVVSLILFAFAPMLASRVLSAPHLVNELRLGCGLLFFNALTGVQIGALSGFEAFKTIAWVSFIRGLLNFPAMIIGVWLFGVLGGVGGMTLVAIAGWWINQRALQQEYQRTGVFMTFTNLKIDLDVLWGFSLPSFLASAMVGPVTWLANTFLVNQPNGYAEMGIFNAVIQWRTALVFLPELIVIQVMLPILSNLYGERDMMRFRRVLWVNIGLMAAISFIFAIPIILASHLIMSAYGTDFSRGAEVLMVIALTTVLSSSIGVIGAAISSMGKMWHGFVLNTIWGLALVLFAQIFITSGAYGLALAYLLSYLIHLISVSSYIMVVLGGLSLKKAY